MERKLYSAPRLPLKETNGNIPLPVLKKARLNGPKTALNVQNTQSTATTMVSTTPSVNVGAKTVANGPCIAPETSVTAPLISKRQPLSSVKQNIPNQRSAGP